MTVLNFHFQTYCINLFSPAKRVIMELITEITEEKIIT